MPKFLIFVLALLVAVTFQNCSSSKPNDPSASQKLQANGDGYGGKATYQDLALDGSCGSEQVKSEIAVAEDGSAVMTRENCVDIAPKQISVSSLMPHNPDHLTFNNKTFQSNINPNAVTKLFCRGDGVNIPQTVRSVVDGLIQISLSDPQKKAAKIIIGQYDPVSGEFWRAITVGSTAVAESSTPSGNGTVLTFKNDSTSSGASFQLKIHNITGQDTWSGALTYRPADPQADLILQPVSCTEM